MNARLLAATAGGLFLLLGSGARALDGWHGKLDDGLAAARKSGKPVLVVTIWKDGV